jgi:hypothetical protein
MRRHKLSRRTSKKMFRKSSSRFHKKNLMGSNYVMRGGIRL